MNNTKKQLVEMVKELKNDQLVVASFNVKVGDRVQYLEKENEEYQSIANDYAPPDEEHQNGYGDNIGNPDTLQKYIKEQQQENEKFSNHIAEQEQELQELRVENTSIHTLKACNHQQKVRIEELEEENQEIKEQSVPKEILFADRANRVKEIAKLKKENEKLKEDNEKSKTELNDFVNVFDGNVSMKELKEEIEELKGERAELWEENEELKDFALKVHNFAFGTKWDDAGVVSAMDFDAIVEEMKKDEGEALAQYNVVVGTSNGYADEVLELKKKNDEFEKDFKPLSDYMSGMTGVCNCQEVVDYIEHLLWSNASLATACKQGKKDVEKAYLETQYHTWRDEQIDRNAGQPPGPADECAYLNLYSDNQHLIKEIFDEIYSDYDEANVSYNVETRTYDVVESDDEE